ncbi:DUF4249 domain-containing protein [Labilibaculum sp. K2S]|uniref:DUF4249 domain-containing protein n=1 Tax=Labilibaculum sp. K2S TaxID=3056386 RepID=UPI0025A378D8|nr:DUF4249 domain-containing protein [Labilibaculum sp. K2S]MDM8161358.1 DUF4249 domain-containing protein [Labilibaculum sp. K2S]
MSRYKIALLFYSFLSVCLFSCTEKFYPEIDSDISILVVDGKITNKPGPYEVRLFRTVDLIKVDTLRPEQGAIIMINDDLGNSEILWEISPGVYRTQNSNFQGQIGRSYWIEIQTNSGEQYESSPETIQPEVIIKSIYGEERKLLLGDASTVNAAKLYIDASDPTNQSSYIKWEYRESWEWRNPYFEPKTAIPSKICYPFMRSDNVFVFDGSGQKIKEFKHLPTSYITENEVKLNYEYFINLSLYSVNFNCYEFWKQIQESIQTNGGLYNVIPANAKGNVCACHSKNPVLGYFEASSVNSMNASFSSKDFQMKFQDFPSDCEDITMKFKDGSPDQSIFHIVRDYFEGEAHIFIVRRNYCYDCSVKYSPTKPSFWP